MILDATGMKGTGKWTVQDAAELGAPVPTIATSVDARVISSRPKTERVDGVEAAAGPDAGARRRGVDKKQLIDDVRAALYAAKACSYAQGMNLLRARVGRRTSWDLQLGELARIWKGGCIIRAQFLGRIKAALRPRPGAAEPAARPELPRRAGRRGRTAGGASSRQARAARPAAARRRRRRSATTT